MIIKKGIKLIPIERMNKKELEEKIIETLSAYSDSSINDLTRLLHCRKNNLIEVVKKLENDRFINSRLEGNKKLISINHDYEEMLVDLFHYVKNIESHIDKKIIFLKKTGKPLEFISENDTYFLKPESKKSLDEIIYLLKSLNHVSGSYSYLKDFDPESKHTESTITAIQKRCVKITRKTIKYLIENYHKRTLKGYIHFNIFRPDELHKLENYFKSQN